MGICRDMIEYNLHIPSHIPPYPYHKIWVMLGYGDMIEGGMKWDMLTWDMKFRDMFWVMIGICWGYVGDMILGYVGI